MSFFIPYRNHFVRLVAVVLVMAMGGLSPIYGTCSREEVCNADEYCSDEINSAEEQGCGEGWEVRACAENPCDASDSSLPVVEPGDTEPEGPDHTGDRCPPGCWCCGTVLSLSFAGHYPLFPDHALPRPILPDLNLPAIPPVAPDRPPRPSVF